MTEGKKYVILLSALLGQWNVVCIYTCSDGNRNFRSLELSLGWNFRSILRVNIMQGVICRENSRKITKKDSSFRILILIVVI